MNTIATLAAQTLPHFDINGAALRELRLFLKHHGCYTGCSRFNRSAMNDYAVKIGFVLSSGWLGAVTRGEIDAPALTPSTIDSQVEVAKNLLAWAAAEAPVEVAPVSTTDLYVTEDLRSACRLTKAGNKTIVPTSFLTGIEVASENATKNGDSIDFAAVVPCEVIAMMSDRQRGLIAKHIERGAAAA